MMKRTRGRNTVGLTPRMVRALGIMATCPAPWNGVQELDAKKIVARSTYYADWMRDPAWVKAVNEVRDEFQGTIRRRAYEQIGANVEAHLAMLQNIAMGKTEAKPGQVEAIREVLRIGGIDGQQQGGGGDIFLYLRLEILRGEADRRIGKDWKDRLADVAPLPLGGDGKNPYVEQG